MSIGNHTMPTEILSSCSDGLLWCFSDWANDVSLGGFWIFALLAFSIVLTLATLRFGNVRAFGFGSFVGMVGAIWLAVLQLIPWWTASAFMIVGLIGLAMMVLSRK